MCSFILQVFHKDYLLGWNPQLDSHQDLGIIMSNNLSWRNHNTHILAKEYKSLGLICHVFKLSHPFEIKNKFYLSLLQPILTYCAPVWWLDINSLERIQRCATKYILNDFTSNYQQWLIKLNILPLMHHYKISDILFSIKSLKNPTEGCNISNCISLFCLPKAHKNYFWAILQDTLILT